MTPDDLERQAADVRSQADSIDKQVSALQDASRVLRDQEPELIRQARDLRDAQDRAQAAQRDAESAVTTSYRSGGIF